MMQSFSVKRLVSAILVTAALSTLAGFAWVNAAGNQSEAALPSSAEYASLASQRTTTDQAPVIEDGVVTYDEYEAAIAQTATCAQQAGVRTIVEPGRGQRPSSIEFVAATLADADVSRARLDDCKARYLDDIEMTWALQNAQPTEQEQREAHRLLSACIESRGAVIDDGYLSVDDLNSLMLKRDAMTDSERAVFDAYLQCRAAVMEELGYVLP